MIGIFVGALLGVAVLVGVIVLLSQPPPPTPCPPDELCPVPPQPTLAPRASPTPGSTLPAIGTPAPTPVGQTPDPNSTPAPTPVSNAAPYVGGDVWRSATLGYSFEYDSQVWRLVDSQDNFAKLTINFRPDLQLGPVEMQVIGFSGDTTVDAALQNVYAQVDTFVIGRTPNNRTYDALLGPGIGYIRGDGGVFSGTFKNGDGSPGAPVGIVAMGATNGRVTVVMLLLSTNPDKMLGNRTVQTIGRRQSDPLVKTFLWEAAQ